MSNYKNFTELEVYKECRLFRKEVSDTAKTFPKEEKYLLTSQILDSSRSITTNIAEGFGRFHFQENIQFCRISRGSLFETLEHLITAFDEKYISSEKISEMKIKHDKCLKLLNGYINYLERAKQEFKK
jgi:four helix bundle protein